MPRYSAAQIYAYARDAGFTPDESTTMTAIAMAESGGDSRAHNSQGEDSRGLWQINAATHPDLGAKYDLYDPAQNAKAAYAVSHGGADVSPWTTTHRGLSARYLRYQDDAQAAAVAHGDPHGLGVWTGTSGYGHPFAAGPAHAAPAGPTSIDTSGSDAVVVSHQTTGTGASTGLTYGLTADGPAGPTYGLPGDDSHTDPAHPLVTTGQGQGGEHLRTFLDVATAQAGDRYVYGVETNLDDPNPKAFDCSELVQWAAHQAGVKVDDGAVYQYRQMARSGTLIPVEDAIHTPGALLFSFGSDPSTTDPTHAHVAISLGDGHTIEARNSRDGVGIFDATTKRFNYAAVIPGMSDHPAPPPPPPVAAPPSEDFEDRLYTDPAPLDEHYAPPDPEPVVEPEVQHPDHSDLDLDGDGQDDSLTGAMHWTDADHHDMTDPATDPIDTGTDDHAGDHGGAG